MKSTAIWVVMAPLAVCAAGCGSSIPPPTGQWEAARTDIARAQGAGAANVPAGALHLQLAQEDLAMSKQLMGIDNRRAGSLAMVAGTEAQLASDIARQVAAQDQQNQAQLELQKALAK
jgi:hypothetical protein